MSSETAPSAPESTALYDFLAWVEVNKIRLALAGVGVILAILLGMTYRWFSAQKAAKADEALFKFLPTTMLQGDGTAPKAEDILRVAEDFKGTTAAERALYLGAGALFQEGKYEESERKFIHFLATHEGSPYAPGANYGIAVCLEARGKPNEAVERYQKIVTQYPNHPEATHSKLAMARIYEAQNKPDQALKLYEDITKSMGMSTSMGLANVRRQALLEKHPQLAPAPVQSIQPTFAPSATSNSKPASGSVPALKVAPPK